MSLPKKLEGKVVRRSHLKAVEATGYEEVVTAITSDGMVDLQYLELKVYDDQGKPIGRIRLASVVFLDAQQFEWVSDERGDVK